MDNCKKISVIIEYSEEKKAVVIKKIVFFYNDFAPIVEEFNGISHLSIINDFIKNSGLDGIHSAIESGLISVISSSREKEMNSLQGEILEEQKRIGELLTGIIEYAIDKKEKSGDVLSSEYRELADYFRKSILRNKGQLPPVGLKEIENLAANNEMIREIENARAKMLSGELKEKEYEDIYSKYREKLTEEILKKNTLVNESLNENKKEKSGDVLSSEYRELADYFRKSILRNKGQLPPVGLKEIENLAANNEMIREIENARAKMLSGELKEKEYEDIYSKYREKLTEEILKKNTLVNESLNENKKENVKTNIGMYGKTSNMSFNEAQKNLNMLNKLDWRSYEGTPVYDEMLNLWEESVATIADSIYGKQDAKLKQGENWYSNLLNAAKYYGSSNVSSNSNSWDNFVNAVYGIERVNVENFSNSINSNNQIQYNKESSQNYDNISIIYDHSDDKLNIKGIVIFSEQHGPIIEKYDPNKHLPIIGNLIKKSGYNLSKQGLIDTIKAGRINLVSLNKQKEMTELESKISKNQSSSLQSTISHENNKKEKIFSKSDQELIEYLNKFMLRENGKLSVEDTKRIEELAKINGKIKALEDARMLYLSGQMSKDSFERILGVPVRQLERKILNQNSHLENKEIPTAPLKTLKPNNLYSKPEDWAEQHKPFYYVHDDSSSKLDSTNSKAPISADTVLSRKNTEVKPNGENITASPEVKLNRVNAPISAAATLDRKNTEVKLDRGNVSIPTAATLDRKNTEAKLDRENVLIPAAATLDRKNTEAKLDRGNVSVPATAALDRKNTEAKLDRGNVSIPATATLDRKNTEAKLDRGNVSIPATAALNRKKTEIKPNSEDYSATAVIPNSLADSSGIKLQKKSLGERAKGIDSSSDEVKNVPVGKEKISVRLKKRWKKIVAAIVATASLISAGIFGSKLLGKKNQPIQSIPGFQHNQNSGENKNDFDLNSTLEYYFNTMNVPIATRNFILQENVQQFLSQYSNINQLSEVLSALCYGYESNILSSTVGNFRLDEDGQKYLRFFTNDFLCAKVIVNNYTPEQMLAVFGNSKVSYEQIMDGFKSYCNTVATYGTTATKTLPFKYLTNGDSVATEALNELFDKLSIVNRNRMNGSLTSKHTDDFIVAVDNFFVHDDQKLKLSEGIKTVAASLVNSYVIMQDNFANGEALYLHETHGLSKAGINLLSPDEKELDGTIISENKDSLLNNIYLLYADDALVNQNCLTQKQILLNNINEMYKLSNADVTHVMTSFANLLYQNGLHEYGNEISQGHYSQELLDKIEAANPALASEIDAFEQSMRASYNNKYISYEVTTNGVDELLGIKGLTNDYNWFINIREQMAYNNYNYDLISGKRYGAISSAYDGTFDVPAPKVTVTKTQENVEYDELSSSEKDIADEQREDLIQTEQEKLDEQKTEAEKAAQELIEKIESGEITTQEQGEEFFEQHGGGTLEPGLVEQVIEDFTNPELTEKIDKENEERTEAERIAAEEAAEKEKEEQAERYQEQLELIQQGSSIGGGQDQEEPDYSGNPNAGDEQPYVEPQVSSPEVEELTEDYTDSQSVEDVQPSDDYFATDPNLGNAVVDEQPYIAPQVSSSEVEELTEDYTDSQSVEDEQSYVEPQVSSPEVEELTEDYTDSQSVEDVQPSDDYFATDPNLGNAVVDEQPYIAPQVSSSEVEELTEDYTDSQSVEDEQSYVEPQVSSPEVEELTEDYTDSQSVEDVQPSDDYFATDPNLGNTAIDEQPYVESPTSTDVATFTDLEVQELQGLLEEISPEEIVDVQVVGRSR